MPKWDWAAWQDQNELKLMKLTVTRTVVGDQLLVHTGGTARCNCVRLRLIGPWSISMVYEWADL